jgi:hypothetical protein
MNARNAFEAYLRACDGVHGPHLRADRIADLEKAQTCIIQYSMSSMLASC